MGRGLLLLGILWWSWVGCAWLTSVVDPDQTGVRLVVFAAMAAMLVAALSLPGAFDDTGLAFAVAYGLVRTAHIVLFLVASRDDADLRRSVRGLALGTAVGVGLLIGGAFLGGGGRLAVWALALALDMAEPYVFGSQGWRLVPGHFAERHGLIILIALGESIVAIGVGAEAGIGSGVIAAGILGTALAAAMWWPYFDVVAFVGGRNLADREPGRERNELARDACSYLHLPMVAGIVVVALGLKQTLAHVGEPLEGAAAFALGGGVALYLLAHVAFRARVTHALSRHRLLLVSAPFTARLRALASLAIVTAMLGAMNVYEVFRFKGLRAQVRAELASDPSSQ